MNISISKDLNPKINSLIVSFGIITLFNVYGCNQDSEEIDMNQGPAIDCDMVTNCADQTESGGSESADEDVDEAGNNTGDSTDDSTGEDNLPNTEDVQCAAAPVCDPISQVEVSDCESQGDACVEVTLCGTTVYCIPNDDGANAGEAGSSDPNDDGSSAGDAGSSDPIDQPNTEDEEETLPAPDESEIQCQAAPVCAPDQQEVEQCEENDRLCESVTICGQTIFCTPVQ